MPGIHQLTVSCPHCTKAISFSKLIADLETINIPKLSITERRVVLLSAQGYNIKEIAKVTGKSVKTIETHRYQGYKKLEVHNLIELVFVLLSYIKPAGGVNVHSSSL